MTTGGAQVRKLEVDIAQLFWIEESKVRLRKKNDPSDPDLVFKNRYFPPNEARFISRHPLFEVEVRITRGTTVFFEANFKRGEGAHAGKQNVNTFSLDPFLARISATNPPSPGADPFVMTLTPGAKQRSHGAAGPDTGFAVGPVIPGRNFETEYRELTLEFKVDAEFRIIEPRVTSGREADRGPNGNAMVLTRTKSRKGAGGTTTTRTQVLHVDWRFDWVRRVLPKVCPKVGDRPGPVSVVVLHQTGNETQGLEGEDPHPAIRHTLANGLGEVIGGNFVGGTISVHYVVDVDGHVVKMADERNFTNHAGFSAWRDAVDISEISIGIEHVHNSAVVGFPAAQLKASADLVERIMREHGIKPFNVVGHAAVKCISDGDINNAASPAIRAELQNRKDHGGRVLNPSDRRHCPGSTRNFDWTVYERRGLTMRPLAVAEMPAGAPKNYRVFIDDSSLELKVGATGPAVKEIQTDLRAIGWPLSDSHPSETFDGIMKTVVERFQERFRVHMPDQNLPNLGIVDAATGALIKRVLAFVRKVESA